MTRTLYLLRHAKATDAGRGGDRERALTPEGKRDAARMGGRMVALGITPALVLCSTAKRAAQTFEQVASAYPKGLAAEYEDPLYSATAEDLMARLQEIDDGFNSALIVGHNPTFHDLAVELAGRGEPELLGRLAEGLPKGGLIALALPAKGWKDLRPATGTLTILETPKDLRPGD